MAESELEAYGALFNAYVFASEPLLLSALVYTPTPSAISSVLRYVWILWTALAFLGVAWHVKMRLPQILFPLIKARVLTALVMIPIVVVIFLGMFVGIFWLSKAYPALFL